MFIKTDSNPMVVRWWMALQELDFEMRFIAGTENSVADALSRLCINNKIGTAKNMVSAFIDSKPLTANHYAAIAQCHNSMVGHSGVDKTVKRLKLIKENGRTDIHPKLPLLPENESNRTTHKRTKIHDIYVPRNGMPQHSKGYLLVIIDTFTRSVNI